MKREIGKPVLVAFIAALSLISCAAIWQDDVGRALEQARSGEYAAAAPVLERAVQGGNRDARLIESLYYCWIRLGQYTSARDKFEAWSNADSSDGPLRLAAARANVLVGNYSRALELVEPALRFGSVSVAASFEKARALDRIGRGADAKAIHERIIDSFQDGLTRSTADLVYVAGAMKALEYFHDANDVFKMATQADARNAEAFVAWGDLLADKYNNPEAIASYQDALKIDANLPEAHLGMARALSLESPEKSNQALETVLKLNPNSIEGNLLAAEHHIDTERYSEAEASIARVTTINPQSAEALSLTAAIQFLRGQMDLFNQTIQRVLQINPEYSDLFASLAEHAVSLRLYRDAVVFAREAIRLNEGNWKAYSTLGVNLLRLGEEDAGKAALEKAYEGDRFNVWTVNTLTLLDSFKNFDRFSSRHFAVKLHKKESAALAPYVLHLLEKAYDALSEKYRFEPEGPITFEMYPDHADFAVRTLGMPGIGALGACFGKVVAMDSPSARKPESFNWGSTLWHEFAHVITLQITDHKIPRWFSEGLSVYEERKAMTGWGDDLKLEYLEAIKGKKLLPVAELNAGFVRPRYPEQVLVSYYQSSLIADFVEQKHGFPAILRMLALYKEGKTTDVVFRDALNRSLEQFDSEFLSWVNARAAAIDPEAYKELLEAGSKQFAENQIDQAIETFNRAIIQYPDYSEEGNPYEPLAEAYLKKGNRTAAIDTLKKFLAYSDTAHGAHMKLAALLQEDGDGAGAREILDRAVFIHPLDLGLHQKLGRALLDQKRYPEASREFEVLLAMGTPDRAEAYFRLAEAKLAEGKRDEARKNILKCLEIAPSYEPAQELLLKIVR